MVTKALTAPQIEAMLLGKLTPSYIEVTDESSLHANHAESIKSGGGHFRLLLVSIQFKGKSRLQRQRLVFAALSEGNNPPALHALSMVLYSPSEWKERAN